MNTAPAGALSLLNHPSTFFVMIDVSKSGAVPSGTDAASTLAALQQEYGAVRYNEQQMLRYPYYSRVQYPAAGSSEINFFGTSIGGNTSLITNAEIVGGLGNFSFLCTGIYFDFWVSAPATTPQPQTYLEDADAEYADIVHGFAQAGVWELKIGNVLWDQCPIPFLFRPPSNGRLRCEASMGMFAMSQSGMSPFAVTGSQTSLAYADLNRRTNRRGNLQNPIFLTPQQNFTGTLSFPSGLLPILATDVVTGSAALYVECVLDGWKFTPVG